MVPQPPNERSFLDRLLKEVRDLMHGELKNVPGVQWIEKRWDAVDVTAKWPKDQSHRNIHGWITGDWPEFWVRFEGAAWRDDEENLLRRVVLLTGPQGQLRVVEGGTLAPTIEFDRGTLGKNLHNLVEQVRKIELDGGQYFEVQLSPRPKPASPFSRTTG